MVSSLSQLQSKGYVTEIDMTSYKDAEEKTLWLWLKHSSPFYRSLAIKLLAESGHNDRYFLSALDECLTSERSLYTKITICNVMIANPFLGSDLMINRLGAIGSNQHHKFPVRIFSKRTYPLPRDIAARTLAHMHPLVLDIIISKVSLDDTKRLSEALDAIGFIVFHNQNLASHCSFTYVRNVIKYNFSDELILWKALMCLGAFSIQESVDLLKDIKLQVNSEFLQKTIDWSMAMIKRRTKDKLNF